jgi:FK506-binding protein 6
MFCVSKLVSVVGLLKVVRPGDGIPIPDNSKIYVHYVCTADGSLGEPYDSTVSRGHPHAIDFRNSDVLVGLFLSIKSMSLREVAKFWIRYDYAFGELGCPPRIPPCTDIFCIVEVLAVVDEAKLTSVPYMSMEQRAALPFQEILKAAEEMKKTGNACYLQDSYWKASKSYRKGVNVLEDYPVIGAEDEEKRKELLYALYNNLAQCFLKLEKPQQACNACHMGLKCKEPGEKGLSKIYFR